MNFNNILKKKTIVVAEIGNNHEGDFNIAKKLIDEAKKCGVDAVKFQTFEPDSFIYKKDKKRLKQIKKFQFSFEQFKKLSQYTKKKNLIFLSTPFDIKSAKFLNKIQDIFKISSGDNTFYPLLKLVAGFNKTIILSTGLINYKEIKNTVRFINNIWKKKKHNNKKLILLHCVSSYPVKDKDANLKSITFLKNNMKKNIIGYSDHTIGINAAIGSVCLGARVIEKHFTLDNKYSKFRDHELSLNPKDMKKLVAEIKKTESQMGHYEKKIGKEEKKNINATRRSIGASKAIKKNKKINLEDLIWVRSSKGLKPGEEKKILKKSKKNYQVGDLLR